MLEIGGVDRNFGGAYITLVITKKRSCQYFEKELCYSIYSNMGLYLERRSICIAS